MKHIRNKIVLATIAAATLLLSGCTKELPNEGLGEGSYLSLSIDGLQTPSTAASAARQGASTRAVDESAVKNLWILQFQMTQGSTTAGTLMGTFYIASVADMKKIKYTPKSGTNMALYLVANTGNSSLFSSTPIGTTLANIKKFANNVPAPTTFTNLPMVGQSASNLTLPTTAAVPVTLTRTLAKVILTIKNGLTTGYPQLTVTGTQIKNVPKTYSSQVINSANGFTGSIYYPSAAAVNFSDYTAVGGNITAAGTTSTYYVAPNVRGIGTNSDDRLKTPDTAPAGQGAYCTYVEILGTAKATAASPTVDVRYRLYLGGNNTNDFNLYSNTTYKVGIELTGLFAADARLTITTDKFDLAQGGIEGEHEDKIHGWGARVGDYFFTDGTTSAKLESGKTVNGMVYYIDPANPSKFKVLALGEFGTKQRSANMDYDVAGALSNSDGWGNSMAMKAAFDAKKAGITITQSTFATAFPAAGDCYNYKGHTGANDAPGTWHLPAKNELQYLYCAFNGTSPMTWQSNTPGVPQNTTERANWNTRLSAVSSTNLTTRNYWSSTELGGNDAQFAWFLRISDGQTSIDNKNVVYYVRCVRDI